MAIGMFGFGWALIPLYGLICDLTGLGGDTGGAYQYDPASTQRDASRLVKVNFLTNTNAGMPWEFWAETTGVRVHPGELKEVKFYVRNTTDRRMVAQAIPSLVPISATDYFHKTECFCFRSQMLDPGEVLEILEPKTIMWPGGGAPVNHGHQSLEDELARAGSGQRLEEKEKALLVAVSTGPAWRAGESLEEMKELALSDDLHVADSLILPIKKVNPRFLMGKGRLRELVLRCLQTGADILVFDDELSPAQVKHLTDETDLKIIDRSQLILDMFAKRAVTREGKIQVELAQLRYLLPRLSTKNTALSRLTGGIGGRGREMRLELRLLRR